MVYSDLTMEYTLQGDLKNAEKFFEKLMKLPTKILIHPSLRGVLPKAVLLAGKNQWKESNQYFKEYLERFKARPEPANESFAKLVYAWALERQGRHEEARLQLEESQKIRQKAEKRFRHADLKVNLIARRKVEVGEEFELRLDLVNVGRNPAILDKIEGVIPSGLKVVDHMSFCSFQSDNVILNEKSVGPFQVETVKLKLKATKTGSYNINPKVTYMNELGQTKTSAAKTFTISASPKQPTFEVLPGRIATGYSELDRLLMGGIPEKYAVVLTGPPSDERAYLIKSFLEAGTAKDEIVFYVTTEADGLENLLRNSNFYLFLCNRKPKTKVPDLPNVTRIRSKTDLTNLNISLVKAYRNIDPSKKKRICVDTVSNVLLNYEAKATCKWISELINDLSSKGFTMLAVIDPSMHPPDQAKAVVNSFDGEISITQTEDPLECKKSLRVMRLRNQEYIKDSICITKS